MKNKKKSRKTEESKQLHSTVEIFNELDMDDEVYDKNTDDMVNRTDIKSQESEKNQNPIPRPFITADFGRSRGSERNRNPSPGPIITSDLGGPRGATQPYSLEYTNIGDLVNSLKKTICNRHI